MYAFETRLETVSDVKKFVQTARDIPVDVSVSQGKYVIDGKSIMGIFSLDLSEPIMVQLPDKCYADEF